MTTIARSRAEPLHGVRQILRFNWPFYAAGVTGVLAVPAIINSVPLGISWRALLYVFAGIACLWICGSLFASWIVYDRSELTSGTWLIRALGFTPRSWIGIHAGFDELSPHAARAFNRDGRLFDVFDPAVMTEGSIGRARAACPAGSQQHEAVSFRRLPLESSSIDAALVLLSAHELRTEESRAALFHELQRTLAPGGKVVVAEHLRDLPNFLAFGPGFLHFHSRASWIQCFHLADLVISDEFAITPFVRVFVLRGER